MWFMKPLAEQYDAIIIGSGFGGAATAHTLAQTGGRILLLESGGWPRRDDLDWNPRKILIEQRYRSDSPLLVRQDGARQFTRVFPNHLVGGLSVMYGGASLRLREKDFARWPLSYADLEPYYCRAERLLGVHGETGQDPHEPPRSEGYPHRPAEPTVSAQRLLDAARALGYRPFRTPVAINFTDPSRPRCIQCATCDGFPCKLQAKNDLAVTLLKDVQAGGVEIATGAIGYRLREAGGRIRAVLVRDRDSGQDCRLSARVVVVAAGALQSPAILLRSGLGRFPQGDLIGRFLMRHCNAAISYFFPFATEAQQFSYKQLCLTDFYEDLRDRFGTATGVIQDIFTPATEIAHHFAPSGLKWLARWVVPYFAPHMQNLLCIAEDEPQASNRVQLAGERDGNGLEMVAVEHGYTRADLERRDYLMARARRVLRRAGGLIPYFYKVGTFSHAVGTLRFGAAPEESVLDPDCRFRGVENLFVLDGSFMPTSGGVNPSLTIAANALRVAAQVIAPSLPAR
jgi:choline dehydrogenase-like flavoprotein